MNDNKETSTCELTPQRKLLLTLMALHASFQPRSQYPESFCSLPSTVLTLVNCVFSYNKMLYFSTACSIL